MYTYPPTKNSYDCLNSDSNPILKIYSVYLWHLDI